MDNFIDVGSGWFFYEDQSNRLTAVCDAVSNEPNQHFGPSAWEGRDGPLSGLTILEARAVLRGQWGQVGPDEWKWFSEDWYEFDEPPSDWPRVIAIKDSQFGPLLSSISGRIVSTNAELAELLRAITINLPQRELPCVAAATRTMAAKSTFPHIFGELAPTPLVQ